MKISVGLWVFGNMADRFMSGGYRDAVDPVNVLSEINGVQGIEFNLSPGLEPQALVQKAQEMGLKVAAVGVDLFSSRKWALGALSSPDDDIRTQAISETQKAMDLAAELGAVVNVWAGQDGYDYPFRTDYPRAWSNMVDSIARIADHNPKVKVSIEYKPKEPRAREIPANMGEALLMAEEVQRDNVGVTIDVGHSLMVGEGLAFAASLALKHGKLFHLHLNDNLGSGDDDLDFGVVHVVDFLEMLSWLEKLGYDGWYSFDLFPYREDPFKAIESSVNNLKKLGELSKRVGADGSFLSKL
ncbi:sugar phosphate isomerase/epimerase family protein [Tardisphaera saccharovorans]